MIGTYSRGAALIHNERMRQIEDEGWSPEHDDSHTDQSLACAATCYAMPPKRGEPPEFDYRRSFWPDSLPSKWFKPSRGNRTRELAKAGALIAAEMDRLFRLEAKQAGEPSDDAVPDEPQAEPESFEHLGTEIGRLVDEKNRAYGDSFARAGNVLRELYTAGVAPDQYDDMLAVVRIIDKLFRIATDRDALGESPFRDIAGYGLLGAGRE